MRNEPQLLADEQVTGNTAAGETLWALGDQLGSVRDLVSYDDIAEDTVLRKHTGYDSYGRVTGEEYFDEGENPITGDGSTGGSGDPANNAAAKDVLFGYTARAFDETTGLQNNLNRWLDATTGKWLSEDPIGFTGGDANLARYVGNHPTGATDPSGLEFITIDQMLGDGDQAVSTVMDDTASPNLLIDVAVLFIDDLSPEEMALYSLEISKMEFRTKVIESLVLDAYEQYLDQFISCYDTGSYSFEQEEAFEAYISAEELKRIKAYDPHRVVKVIHLRGKQFTDAVGLRRLGVISPGSKTQGVLDTIFPGTQPGVKLIHANGGITMHGGGLSNEDIALFSLDIVGLGKAAKAASRGAKAALKRAAAKGLKKRTIEVWQNSEKGCKMYPQLGEARQGQQSLATSGRKRLYKKQLPDTLVTTTQRG